MNFTPFEVSPKLREMILYITSRCGSREDFGATLLNKVLFQSDSEAFVCLGKTVTETEYERKDFGPVPKQMNLTRQKMTEDGDVANKTAAVACYVAKQLVPLRRPNLDLFSPSEIALVDQVIANFDKKTATQASEETHGIAWKILDNYETYPIAAAFISNAPPSAADRDLAERLAEAHNWKI
ncbi:MAG: Panacea domain-containing protein [Verrucomicrobiota bacterium]